MSLEKVFNRKQVKEIAEQIPMTIGEMQRMFSDYGIRVFNTETNELEIATIHTATTADLLSVIKYYEDNLTRIAKENTEEQERIIRIDERIKTFKSAQAVWGFNFQIPIAENESLLERLKYEQTHNPLATDEGEKDNGK
ncbi:MAG: hypothetical protein M0P61_00185 [Ignavibacteriaceae bacterium]|jgi:hypothetical protein|nr:hypothetical protein [Ignavibacteriaceae bacterium]